MINNHSNNYKNSSKFFPHGELEEEFRILEEMLNYEHKFNSINYKKILVDLKSNEDLRILDAISHLCTELSMVEEGCPHGFHCEAFVPEILNCLKKESFPDIMSYFSFFYIFLFSFSIFLLILL